MGLKKFILSCVLSIVILNVNAQPPYEANFINGRLELKININLNDEEIKSIAHNFDIKEEALASLIKQGKLDELKAENWNVLKKTAQFWIISTKMESGDMYQNIENKITFWEVGETDKPGYVNQDRVVFGFNKFKKSESITKPSANITRFELWGFEDAKSVIISGNFNDWNTLANPMTKSEKGWMVDLNLKPGKYLYKFIVDGHWRNDPNNELKEYDGYGSNNSVYYETNYVFSLKLNDKAKKIILSGSFNGWNESEAKLKKNETTWTLPVYIRNGSYEYKYIVDGHWINDPENKMVVKNEHNDFNSFIALGDLHQFNLLGFKNAKAVFLAGDFNNWIPNIPCLKNENGWSTQYAIYPGNYQYKYFVDGRWMLDPLADSAGNDIKNSVVSIQPNYTFRLKGFEQAKKAIVSGTFNNWNEDFFVMKRDKDGWFAHARVPLGKTHYKFIVDGKWINDPDNNLKELNEHNTFNSILWIKNDQ
jgi:hypothetical protein